MIVGILGGGQLGRMLALAGHPLGLRFVVLDPAADACAAAVAGHVEVDFSDADGLARLAERCGVVTYEFENVPVDSVRLLAQRLPVHPGAAALEVAQDRLNEKNLFRRLGIPTPAFAPVDSRADLDAAVKAIGLPAVLKTRRFGYDGKGQAVLREPADVDAAWSALGGQPLILEGFVAFEREVSMISVRGRDGAIRHYPVSENRHAGGILRLSVARPDDPMRERAQAHAGKVLEALEYVGVLAVEFFVAGDTLVGNEIAPRVHNSGHWTIEGAETSQFENHLRAVAGLPLGATRAIGHAAMVNFIGDLPPAERILEIPGAHLHAYGKYPKRGRKVGHATVRAPDAQALAAALARVEVLAAEYGQG